MRGFKCTYKCITIKGIYENFHSQQKNSIESLVIFQNSQSSFNFFKSNLPISSLGGEATWSKERPLCFR